MKHIAVVTLVVSTLVVMFASTARAADPPTDRVIVMYFHRTQRCPTCLKMGSYSEEAVVKGFAQQIEDGTVEFHYVDFQDKKNAALTIGYKIGGPSLIVARVAKNKVLEVNDLKEIWTKNRDKEVFLKYVRDNVAAYQKPTSQNRAEAGTRHLGAQDEVR